MNGYGAIFCNDEGADNFYIFVFTSVQYIVQEDVDSDVNNLAYVDLVCNEMYTYIGQHK